jgi:hypothetical protein
MGNVLQSKRDSSRFQILVEIAAHQPNLRQKEVAEKLGVTPHKNIGTENCIHTIFCRNVWYPKIIPNMLWIDSSV